VFWTRLASGVVLAPLFLVLVYLQFPYFHLLVIAIAGVMAWEFTRMDGRAGKKRRSLIAIAAVAAVVAMALGQAIAALLTIVVATLALVAADQVAGRRGFYIVQMAVIYVALPAVALIYVMAVGHGHRRLCLRPDHRRAEAGAVRQPEQDMVRRDRRSGIRRPGRVGSVMGIWRSGDGRIGGARGTALGCKSIRRPV
jgi:hypothetical protein